MVAVPVKFNVGTKITFVPLMLAVPFVGVTDRIVSEPPGVRMTSLMSGLTVFVVFSVMLALSRFASGGKFVINVTTGGVTLFVGVGSGVGLPPLAKFVSEPRCVEMTVSVKLLAAFAARLPTFQMT